MCFDQKEFSSTQKFKKMMEEEFKVVKRKKKKGKTSKIFRQTNNDGKPLTSCVEDEVDVEKVMSRLDVCRNQLEGSCFWHNLKELVARAVQLGTNSYKIENATNCFHIKKATPNIKDAIGSTNTAEDRCGVINQHKIDHISADADNVSLDCKLKRTEVEDKSEEEINDCAKIDSIVCYGLGNFVSCINARYQLSLLLLIVHHFKIPPSMCYCYDPVFTNTERSILTQYGLSCLELNEEGKRRVEKLTFFYMPHCGKPLYNNLLWSNWGNSLANLLIFGNSFKNIEERFPSKLLEEEVPYIKAILPFTQQLDVENNFKFLDIFNDIAVHIFPASSLQQAPSITWQSAKEPNYSNITDAEIIFKNS